MKWESLLWMLLGWAIGWEFTWIIGSSIDNFFIGGLIGGAGAGTSIAWVLQNESVIRKKVSLLLLVIGWSIAGGIGLLFYRVIDITIGGSLCGLIGGITMVLALWKENILSDKSSIIFISLGWILGLTIGWEINSSNFSYIVQFASMWSVAGVMMTRVLSPNIKAENQTKAFTWIIFGWFIGGAVCYIVMRLGLNYIGSLVVDDIGGIMMAPLFYLGGLGIGILVGITITTWVIIKEKTLDYAQISSRIALGLLSLIGIGFIAWIVLWVLSELQDYGGLTYFAINNVIGGIIGWGIMVWALRKT